MRWPILVLPLIAVVAQRSLAADLWSDARPITVVLVDDRFQPDHLTLQAGKPYHLHLENRGKTMHEFTAPAFWHAARVRDAASLANGGTDVVVEPGQSVTIDVIAPPAGHYDLTCADHDWDGMTGTIDVR
jgi:uncharacterized cupredoxin-like copper-binding protein